MNTYDQRLIDIYKQVDKCESRQEAKQLLKAAEAIRLQHQARQLYGHTPVNH
jgi:hypothetical protein